MFQRLSNLIRGFFSLFISGLERQNPEALLEVEQENLRRQIGQYNQGLATHAGLCERLISQVRQLENEQRDLRARTTANLRAGNREAAAQLALRLQTIDRELDENRGQLEQAEKTYKDLVKARDVAINAARQKMESLKAGISDMKMKKAMAELTEMASGMVTSIGSSGETLDRLSNTVEEERTKAAGRVRVARDSMDMSGVVMKEMVLKGPSSYDAAMVYENVAIDFLKNAEGRWGQIRVVYPEYNAWNENPYYIINAPWSTPEQRKAAETFLTFLLTERIQREALVHGFRPANPSVPVKFPESPFVAYAGSGVQIDLQKICEPPKAEVVNNLLSSWQRTQGNR